MELLRCKKREPELPEAEKVPIPPKPDRKAVEIRRATVSVSMPSGGVQIFDDVCEIEVGPAGQLTLRWWREFTDYYWQAWTESLRRVGYEAGWQPFKTEEDRRVTIFAPGQWTGFDEKRENP